MSRLGLSFAEVATAADELIQSGEQPTIEKIRDQLGKRGSFSTISKYLKDWREGRLIPKSTQLSPPDQVQAAVSAVWEKLHEETQTTIEAVQVEAKKQVEAARQEAQAAQGALSTVQAEHQQLTTQYHALSAQKELLALDYQQAETTQQLLRERLAALETRHQEIKSLHEQQLKRVEEQYLAEMERLKLHTDQEVQLARQLADTLKAHYEEARAESMRHIDQLKVENQQRLDAIKGLEKDHASLKAALTARTDLSSHLSTQLAEAQKLIQSQQAQWDSLKDKRLVTEEVVAGFQLLPKAVSSELCVVLTEQVRQVVDEAIKLLQLRLKEEEAHG